MPQVQLRTRLHKDPIIGMQFLQRLRTHNIYAMLKFLRYPLHLARIQTVKESALRQAVQDACSECQLFAWVCYDERS